MNFDERKRYGHGKERRLYSQRSFNGRSSKGATGIDEESIEEFEKNLKENLYKIWNHMSSGSYFPPLVKTVEIPKSDGKMRRFGIPTVSDKIAQIVVKIYLEPITYGSLRDQGRKTPPTRSVTDLKGFL